MHAWVFGCSGALSGQRVSLIRTTGVSDSGCFMGSVFPRMRVPSVYKLYSSVRMLVISVCAQFKTEKKVVIVVTKTCPLVSSLTSLSNSYSSLQVRSNYYFNRYISDCIFYLLVLFHCYETVAGLSIVHCSYRRCFQRRPMIVQIVNTYVHTYNYIRTLILGTYTHTTGIR